MTTINQILPILIKTDINHTIKTAQLDNANIIAFKIVLDLLHGKKRPAYTALKKELLKSYDFSQYVKTIINNAFDYKENKIICNIDMLPVTTLNKLTKSVKNGLQLDDIKNVFKTLENKNDRNEYNSLMLECIKNNTPKLHNDFNLSNEITKLLEISDNDKNAIIEALQATLHQNEEKTVLTA